MTMVSKLALSVFVTGALALGSVGVVPAYAGTAVTPEAGAPVISKQQAIQIAENAVQPKTMQCGRYYCSTTTFVPSFTRS
jgi:hypothetical protein